MFIGWPECPAKCGAFTALNQPDPCSPSSITFYKRIHPMIKFKPFQREDLARAALVDGLILAWEPGLGKSLGALAWALLKCGFSTTSAQPLRPVLLVAPGDLHGQWAAELQGRFGGHFTPVPDVASYRALLDAHGQLPGGWYVTSYTQLTRNGTQSGRLPLAAHLATAFACVMVDEGVRMKSTDSKMGQGLRLLNPPYRILLTGTPVKNLISDLFWLAWWTAGGREEAHGRFPFHGTAEGHLAFVEQFMMQARNLSARSGRTHFTPHLSSVHMLWKICAPVILRRRREDTGESMVKINHQVVRVAMGLQQRQVYQYHLNARYVDRHGKDAMGARLQALRIAAAAPHSLLLQPVGEAKHG